MKTLPIRIDTDEGPIAGHLDMVGGHGFVTADRYPADYRLEEARLTLRSAVLDGRCKLPEDVSTELDLIGRNPKVR